MPFAPRGSLNPLPHYPTDSWWTVPQPRTEEPQWYDKAREQILRIIASKQAHQLGRSRCLDDLR